MSRVWPWLILFGLGAYHGINPAMGWLFAVSLGLQTRSRRAVLMAIPPIAIGHAISIVLVVGLLWLAQASLPLTWVRYGAAAILFAFGLSRFIRSRHPKWVGMRVGFKDLTLWSFLMASAHGAGLMLLPVFLLGEGEAPCHGPSCHQAAGLTLTSWPGYLAAVGLHTSAMLFTAGGIALLVYYKLGVSLLRQTWFNLDRAWAGAMIAAGVIAVAL